MIRLCETRDAANLGGTRVRAYSHTAPTSHWIRFSSYVSKRPVPELTTRTCLEQSGHSNSAVDFDRPHHQKSGAAMKIVFGVSNVRKYQAEREADGLRFGPIHSPGEFESANAKDAAGNSIQISSRGIRKAVKRTTPASAWGQNWTGVVAARIHP